MKYKVAIVGATGVVGRTALKIINEKNFLDCEFVLYASKKSKGKRFFINKKKVIVNELTEEIFNQKLDFALFCTSEKISKKYVVKLSKQNVTVIDFSAEYRKKYPLIVPEINACDIKDKKIICNPNCSTIASVMALYKIKEQFGLKRIIYSSYQAVSGAGMFALKDLKVNKQSKLKKLNYIIKDNLIPCIGEIYKNLYSKEENKMVYETRKIFNNNSLKITATCVRVPITICHSISINFETQKRASLKKIKQVLLNTKGVKVIDTPTQYPMPIIVKGKDDVYVGRIRKDYSNKNSFNIFVVSDNLKKGAAQNGLQILEYLLGRGEWYLKAYVQHLLLLLLIKKG